MKKSGLTSFISSKDWRLLKRAFSYVKPHWLLFAATFVAIIGGIIIELIQPLLYGQVVDAILAKDLHHVYQVLMWVLGLTLVHGGVSLVETYLTDLLGNRIIIDLKQDLYHHILNLPVKVFDNLQVGEFVSRLEGDVATLSNIITFESMRVVLDVIRLLGIGYIIFKLSAALSWIILCVFPIVSLVMYLFGKILRKKNEELRVLNDSYYSFITESFAGVREIKALHIENFIQARFLEKVKKVFQIGIQTDVLGALSSLSAMFLNNLSHILVMGAGGFLIVNGQMTMGDYVAFNNFSTQFRQTLGRMAELNVTIQQALVSLERIFDLIDHFMLPIEESAGIVPGQVTGRVDFHQVKFGYETDLPVLRDINFVARPGQLTALVGTSGSGKTTLFNLLLRFYQLEEGQICLDGHPLEELDLEFLRQQVAVVNQEPFLFNLSIRENLRLAKPDATDEEMLEATKKAYIHDTIISLPNGYETVVGERGTRLSGGQKQRLAIARAILKGSQIILLDEATSALDGEAESYIQKTLHGLLPHHTVILIAHRLSTVIEADQIIVLSGGKVVGAGTHQELIATNNVYQRLYQSSVRQISS